MVWMRDCGVQRRVSDRVPRALWLEKKCNIGGAVCDSACPVSSLGMILGCFDIYKSEALQRYHSGGVNRKARYVDFSSNSTY